MENEYVGKKWLNTADLLRMQERSRKQCHSGNYKKPQNFTEKLNYVKTEFDAKHSIEKACIKCETKATE